MKAVQTDALEVTQGLNDKSKAVPLRFALPLTSMKPGSYTCQVNVFDPTNQKFVIWRSPVTLVQ
jgi:hypothetical protein